jgi:hypothetical protein
MAGAPGGPTEIYPGYEKFDYDGNGKLEGKEAADAGKHASQKNIDKVIENGLPVPAGPKQPPPELPQAPEPQVPVGEDPEVNK